MISFLQPRPRLPGRRRASTVVFTRYFRVQRRQDRIKLDLSLERVHSRQSRESPTAAERVLRRRRAKDFPRIDARPVRPSRSIHNLTNIHRIRDSIRLHPHLHRRRRSHLSQRQARHPPLEFVASDRLPPPARVPTPDPQRLHRHVHRDRRDRVRRRSRPSTSRVVRHPSTTFRDASSRGFRSSEPSTSPASSASRVPRTDARARSRARDEGSRPFLRARRAVASRRRVVARVVSGVVSGVLNPREKTSSPRASYSDVYRAYVMRLFARVTWTRRRMEKHPPGCFWGSAVSRDS